MLNYCYSNSDQEKFKGKIKTENSKEYHSLYWFGQMVVPTSSVSSLLIFDYKCQIQTQKLSSSLDQKTDRTNKAICFRRLSCF